MSGRITSTLCCLAVLSLARGAFAAPKWPDVKVERDSAFEGSTSTSGVLRRAYCFEHPKVCVPAGSWVWFTGSFCSNHSDPGCDDSGALPSVRAVDASAPITVAGLVFAAHPHRKLRNDEDEGSREYSVQLDDGRQLEGLLHAGAVVKGLKLARGHVVLEFGPDEKGEPTLGEVLEGITAEATTIEGWQVPAGTAFHRSADLSLSLTKRSPRGAVFTRTEGEPKTATSVHHVQRNEVTGSFIEERLGLASPLQFAGVSFAGVVLLTRPLEASEWQSVSGPLAAPLSEGSLEAPAGTVVTRCADQTIEWAFAPRGTSFTFLGHRVGGLLTRREPSRNPGFVGTFMEHCEAGKLVGYNVELRRCNDGASRGEVSVDLTGKALTPAAQAVLDDLRAADCRPRKLGNSK